MASFSRPVLHWGNLKSHEAGGQIDAGPHRAPARDCTWAASQPLSQYPPALLSQEKPPLASLASKTSEETGRYQRGLEGLSPSASYRKSHSVSDLGGGGALVLLNSGQKGLIGNLKRKKKVKIFSFPNSRSQIQGLAYLGDDSATELSSFLCPKPQMESCYVAQAGYIY